MTITGALFLAYVFFLLLPWFAVLLELFGSSFKDPWLTRAKWWDWVIVLIAPFAVVEMPFKYPFYSTDATSHNPHKTKPLKK